MCLEKTYSKLCIVRLYKLELSDQSHVANRKTGFPF